MTAPRAYTGPFATARGELLVGGIPASELVRRVAPIVKTAYERLRKTET